MPFELTNHGDTKVQVGDLCVIAQVILNPNVIKPLKKKSLSHWQSQFHARMVMNINFHICYCIVFETIKKRKIVRDHRPICWDGNQHMSSYFWVIPAIPRPAKFASLGTIFHVMIHCNHMKPSFSGGQWHRYAQIPFAVCWKHRVLFQDRGYPKLILTFPWLIIKFSKLFKPLPHGDMANFGNFATKKKGWKIFPFTEIKISNYLRLSKVYRKRMAYTLF